jgi:large subunit ribosomal protein L7/L12
MNIPNLEKIVEELSKLTILEANKLASSLEEKWGVPTIAPTAVLSSTSDSSAQEVKQKSFEIILESYGSSKIKVIKAAKEAFSLGLKEAKELIEKAPTVLKSVQEKSEADEFKKKFEEAGAKIKIK